MQSYIQSLIYISIFVVIVELILPSSNLKRFVAVIVSLIVIITIISPIHNFANEDAMQNLNNVISAISNPSNFQDKIESTDIDISKYSSKTILSRFKMNLEKLILKALKSDLKDNVSVDDVNIILDNKSQIQEIKIYISNIKEDNIQNITNILDGILSKYNVPKDLLTIIKK